MLNKKMKNVVLYWRLGTQLDIIWTSELQNFRCVKFGFKASLRKVLLLYLRWRMEMKKLNNIQQLEKPIKKVEEINFSPGTSKWLTNNRWKSLLFPQWLVDILLQMANMICIKLENYWCYLFRCCWPEFQVQVSTLK